MSWFGGIMDKTAGDAEAVEALTQKLQQLHMNQGFLDAQQQRFSELQLGQLQPRPEETGMTISAGCIGHPDTCAGACPYIKRKGGCRDGADCPKCHLCFWQRASVRAKNQNKPSRPGQTLAAPVVAGLQQQQKPLNLRLADAWAGRAVVTEEEMANEACTPCSPDAPPSVGSIGHPHACGQACKYNHKGKGCKDGRWCVRCHLCRWRRYQQ